MYFYHMTKRMSRYGHFFVFVRLLRSCPQLFVICPAKSGESGLGTLLKRTAMKFCIEWSNRELLRPSRRRDMAISLFRHSAFFPPSANFSAFGADVPVDACQRIWTPCFLRLLQINGICYPIWTSMRAIHLGLSIHFDATIIDFDTTNIDFDAKHVGIDATM